MIAGAILQAVKYNITPFWRTMGEFYDEKKKNKPYLFTSCIGVNSNYNRIFDCGSQQPKRQKRTNERTVAMDEYDKRRYVA